MCYRTIDGASILQHSNKKNCTGQTASVVVATVLELFVLLLTLFGTYKHVLEVRRLKLPMGVAAVLLLDGKSHFATQTSYVNGLYSTSIGTVYFM